MKWKWSGFLVAAVFAALTVGLWAYFNRPTDEPPWPDRVQGMAFSPFYSGQNPVYQVMPTEAQIEADLALLADKATAVRTYSSLKTLNLVPAIAAKHQIKVAVGAWVDRDHAHERARDSGGDRPGERARQCHPRGHRQ